ncbi:MAG: DNA polymerase IV [Fidelibacterota bacterium]
MSHKRFVAHLDLDAFFCAVEVLKDPGLRDKPIVVGGSPDRRGVVAAASYPARKFGIHSAMPMAQAVGLCPDLIIISHGFASYKAYSRIIMGIIADQAPVMQQVSIDEAYFELTDSLSDWDDGLIIAKRIKDRISRDIGLTSSVGVATNKLLAKIASDFDKPDGFTVVRPGTELSFLAPLPVQKISGIGKQTTTRLNAMGIKTVLELRNTPQEVLMNRFGKYGVLMSKWAHGIDERTLTEEHRRKSISQERTFDQDIYEEQVLLEKLRTMSNSVAETLDKKEMAAKIISVKMRYADFRTVSKQKSFQRPIWKEHDIYGTAAHLFQKNRDPDQPLRLLGVGVSGLIGREYQLTLF